MIPLDEIHVLQLGEKDWNGVYDLPEFVSLNYIDCFEQAPPILYDMCFLDRTPLEEEILPLYQTVKAYTLFVTDQVELSGRVEQLCKSKKAQRIAAADIQEFLLKETKYYYPKPYGEKFRFNHLSISRYFSGSIEWNGNYNVTLTGEFGEKFSQIVFWRNNVPMQKGQVIDLWLEYQRSPGVSVSLTVTQFAGGSVSEILNRWEFDETQLEQVIRIGSERMNSYLFFSLSAKGGGELKVIALHDRNSRGTHGHFLPGGERYVTSEREEIFCYFDPRDLKPPLNVFFGGWEIVENFQGYNLNRKLGCPFLLLEEHRLMGGSFYAGTREYEKLVVAVIKKYMEELGFSSDQVILSGLSMGAFASMYYGCEIKPHALILMKPLAGIGNVAANEKYSRPGGYPTSLDVLRYLGGSLREEDAGRLNDKFWKKFDGADWGKTKFIITYMIEDDFESGVYDAIISHLHSEGVQVYGKGLHGRHGDSQTATANWFSTQFKKLLKEDFSERNEGV